MPKKRLPSDIRGCPRLEMQSVMDGHGHPPGEGVPISVETQEGASASVRKKLVTLLLNTVYKRLFHRI